MSRLRSKSLVEEYSLLSVRELFIRSSGIVGRVDVYNAGEVSIRYWTRSDNHGTIEANGKTWFVEYVPRSNWPGNRDEYFADYLIHSPSTRQRHKYLLISEDGRVATRSEIKPHYYSQRLDWDKTRIEKRATIIRTLMLNNKPDDMSLIYIEMPEKPVRQMHRRTWERQQAALYGREYVLCRKPFGMHPRRFVRYLRLLNKPHRGKEDGKDTMREINRVFGA